MSVLITPALVAVRRGAVAPRGGLGILADRLARGLAPLLERGFTLPAQKALLSRAGGRCAEDGATLDFDPWSPHAHRCPRCGRVHRGEEHDRWWITFYHLWLVERAVQAAALGALQNRDDLTALARDVLATYADRYLEHPNVDNVLGPSRLFFSTYLESIWLLNFCLAADTLATHGESSALGARLAERVVAPSATLIGSYDEGASNRQVWNSAALLAAARLLGDDDGAERAALGRSGVATHLCGGLLADGTWYEGENYHLFAHRGLWYGVALAEHAGISLDAEGVRRFDAGFAAPFLTALPDDTLPSRRDSQYAISLRQPRFAELAELGLARPRLAPRDELTLRAALARLYAGDVPRGETGQATSTADVERNRGATALDRDDLGWRSLLFARASLPTLDGAAPSTVLLPSQGLAVFRRAGGERWIALDYGASGGGHGHPDRLNLLIAERAARWLDDMGTGSYVDPSLHWYRSTLAHNAPLVDGVSQARADGRLLAFDERGAAGWIDAEVFGAAPGVRLARTVVATDEYVIDELRWEADREIRLELPIHLAAEVTRMTGEPVAFEATVLEGGRGQEDGFGFVREGARAVVGERESMRVRATRAADERTLNGIVAASGAIEWWQATAPAAPGAGAARFQLLRARARAGAIRSVWWWGSSVAVATPGDITEVHLADGTWHQHRRTADGWQIELHALGARSTIDLAGVVAANGDVPRESAIASVDRQRDARDIMLSSGDGWRRFALGEESYRRSEEIWSEAGSPRAEVRVRLAREGDALDVAIRVWKDGPLTFAPADAVNRYDNEQPDVNGDGVQLYAGREGKESGWVLVPERAGSGVRVRAIEGWSGSARVNARWERLDDGYELRARVDLGTRVAAPDALGLDVIVNEMPAKRERRRGQLVLSGGAGEFVYLRGDRHERERLLRIRVRR